jgi:uncharacterized protein YjbI with pentapeptide repeats
LTLTIIAALLIALAAVVLWKVPRLQIERYALRHPTLTPVDLLKGEIDLRSTLAQILGGTVLLTGMYFTAKTYVLQQQGQLTDRINKAVEQLGSDKQDVSLGGIYQLGRIAQDSERDHWPMLQVLLVYTERRAPLKAISPAESQARCDPQRYYDSSETANYNIQAVANVLRAREPNLESSDQQISITHSDLRHINFSGATLKGARFIGDDMEGAVLIKTVLAAGAQLTFSLLDHANLSTADFSGADLERACLVRAQLTGTNFQAARLQNADLRNIVDSNGATFDGARLDGADLRGADLQKAKGMTSQQLDLAKWDCTTQLPDDLVTLRAKLNCAH